MRGSRSPVGVPRDWPPELYRSEGFEAGGVSSPLSDESEILEYFLLSSAPFLREVLSGGKATVQAPCKQDGKDGDRQFGRMPFEKAAQPA